MVGWYIEKGPESDVVISSRVRLARNLSDYPFPFKMTGEQGGMVLAQVRDAVTNTEAIKRALFIDIQNLNSIDKQALVEKHLISPDLAENQRICGAMISRDERVSIMINEEDHLRIQCLFSGMQIDKAWELCNKIDSMLEDKIKFAFDNRYGYLTCCPTNVGTGVRASTMLHLPALTMTGYIRNILEACSKLSIAVRGIYGENSEASGDMFQISNQVTLGQKEEDIIANVVNITQQIIEQERMLRSELYELNPLRFEDKVYRSLGILENARVIPTEESIKLISDVRLGVNMGIIKNVTIETLNEIMLSTQPANLQKIAGKPLDPQERDIRRAEYIRSRIDKRQQNDKDINTNV